MTTTRRLQSISVVKKRQSRSAVRNVVKMRLIVWYIRNNQYHRFIHPR